MPFILIKGKFDPGAGIPDGDSVRFRANDLQLWSKLEGPPVNISNKTKTVQLRLEGIDAIEKGATKPLSTEAKENLFRLIHYNKDNNPTPLGYILTRMTDDKTRRPICFIFTGNTSDQDGSTISLNPVALRQSINYRQMVEGYAYPLYYNTLFAVLREEFNKALKIAKNGGKGYWPKDRTRKGVSVKGHSDVANIAPIWPKLWRRLEEYLRKNSSLNGFIPWLEARNERIDILSLMEERGLQDLVEVHGNNVKMNQNPENLRVVGKAGHRNR